MQKGIFWATAAFINKDEGIIIEWSEDAVSSQMDYNGNYPEDIFCHISFPKEIKFPAVVMLDIEADDDALTADVCRVLWQGED